VKKRKQRFYN